MLMSHVAFVIEYPGGPRMMFGELQHARATPAKEAAYTLIRRYAEWVSTKLEEGKVTGESFSDTDTPAAAILFIGTIPGLVIHSMVSGDFKSARANADEVLAAYLRGLRADIDVAARDKSRCPVNSDRGRQT